ncbi:MAG: thiamine phosphate synthase [Candidatus Aminicenantaceae bacterium]
MKNIDWKLCLVADAEVAGEKNIISCISEAVEGGVTIVQLRGKKLKTREFLEIGQKSAEILKAKNIPLIINDRIDIALSCEAEGVHLGQRDLPLFFARKIMGANKLIGVSVNTVKEATDAEKGGANYLGAGPVFFTQTKKNLRPLLGLRGLQNITKEVKIPVLAIGGINSENAGDTIKAGADGVAVVSAILTSENIRHTARELVKAIEKEGRKQR